jgi:NitT/TauT family transport system substrate-binding protein
MVSTTSKFHADHPEVCAAVLKAVDEANRMIVADKATAAKLLLTAEGEGGFSLQEIVDVLGDPAIKFTTTPENIVKYADFMHLIGSIRNHPVSWKVLFFPEIHEAPGS